MVLAVVLGLRHEIGGDPRGIRGSYRRHQYFGWARDHVGWTLLNTSRLAAATVFRWPTTLTTGATVAVP